MNNQITPRLIKELIKSNKRSIELFKPIIPGGLGLLAILKFGGIGGVMTSTLTDIGLNILNDYFEKKLSKKQKSRVEVMIDNSFQLIADRILSGEELRSDEFIEEDNSEKQSGANELLETILNKVQNENSEKKIKFLSFFYANTVFLEGFSLDSALRFFKIFDELSYRQLRLLKLFEENGENNYKLRSSSYINIKDDYRFDVISVNQEIIELYNWELVFGRAFSNIVLLKYWFNVNPSEIILTQLGREFYQMFNLIEVVEKPNDIVNLLKK